MSKNRDDFSEDRPDRSDVRPEPDRTVAIALPPVGEAEDEAPAPAVDSEVEPRLAPDRSTSPNLSKNRESDASPDRSERRPDDRTVADDSDVAPGEPEVAVPGDALRSPLFDPIAERPRSSEMRERTASRTESDDRGDSSDRLRERCMLEELAAAAPLEPAPPLDMASPRVRPLDRLEADGTEAGLLEGALSRLDRDDVDERIESRTAPDDRGAAPELPRDDDRPPPRWPPRPLSSPLTTAGASNARAARVATPNRKDMTRIADSLSAGELDIPYYDDR